LQKANVAKLTVNISTIRMSDLIIRLGCSLSYIDIWISSLQTMSIPIPLSLLAKPVDSVRKRWNSICYFHYLAENSAIIFSTMQPFQFAKSLLVLSSWSSTVRGVMFTRRVTSLTTCI